MAVTSLMLTCFLCMSLTVYWCYGHGYPDCDIDKFKVQQNFNSSRFEGYWYAISANQAFNPFRVATANANIGGMGATSSGMFGGFNVGMPRQMPWAGRVRHIRNLQYYFEMTSENGTMTTLTSGTTMGRRCFNARGLNSPVNASDPAKTDYVFQGNTFPIWVISTDYDGYAVIYSCWNTNAHGECGPDSAYVTSLNRVREGHTPAELVQVEAASTYVCMPPTELRPVFHNGGCAFNATYFPLEEFSIINEATNNVPLF